MNTPVGLPSAGWRTRQDLGYRPLTSFHPPDQVDSRAANKQKYRKHTELPALTHSQSGLTLRPLILFVKSPGHVSPLSSIPHPPSTVIDRNEIINYSLRGTYSCTPASCIYNLERSTFSQRCPRTITQANLPPRLSPAIPGRVFKAQLLLLHEASKAKACIRAVEQRSIDTRFNLRAQNMHNNTTTGKYQTHKTHRRPRAAAHETTE